MKQTVKTKFYTFNQNNSGGGFVKSDKEGISEHVIIEASKASHANRRAKKIGLYFDGCDKDIDCSCCGDRWFRTDESNGYEIPYIYGEPLSNFKKPYHSDSCFIHYLDSTFEKIVFKENTDDIEV